MILYFTGTGNSRYLAKKISAETGEELFCINEKIKAGETGEIKVHGNLIFVTPTYAWRIPKLVREWILHTDFTGVNRVWFVMNCGDSIGKADSYNQKLCMQKGWEYMGTLQITMPENYIAMFPVPEPKESKRIIEEAGPVIKKAIQCIGTGEKFPEPKHHLADGLLSGAVNQVFYPLFVKADAFTAKDSCVGCGKCEQLCPLNNIRIKEGKPVWGKNCTHCMACICACPREAIEYGKKSVGKVRYYCE